MLRDDLEGWDDRGGGEAQDGEDICILLADSCCCMKEINTTF